MLFFQQIKGNKNTECVQLVKLKNQLKLDAKLVNLKRRPAQIHSSLKNVKSGM